MRYKAFQRTGVFLGGYLKKKWLLGEAVKTHVNKRYYWNYSAAI